MATFRMIVCALLVLALSTVSDLAGNRIDRPFEIDVFEKIGKETTGQTHSVSFTVD